MNLDPIKLVRLVDDLADAAMALAREELMGTRGVEGEEKTLEDAKQALTAYAVKLWLYGRRD